MSYLLSRAGSATAVRIWCMDFLFKAHQEVWAGHLSVCALALKPPYQIKIPNDESLVVASVICTGGNAACQQPRHI